MDIWNASLLYKADLLLGEGPYWHAEWGKFLFVDIQGKLIGAIDLETCAITIKQVAKMPGMVTAKAGKKLVVAFQGSIEEFDFESGRQHKLIDLEPDKENNRCNDGACDAMGRLWIGTMHMDAQLHAGALYCFNGNLKEMISGTSISNGICWSTDQKTMYYIDSFAYNITAYDFDMPAGTISNKRVILELANDKDHLPDGMCIDEQGMLWVAIWGAGCVNRYSPANGRLIGKVNVPAPNVTSCAFGGTDMKQLLITTAKAGLTTKNLEQFPDSGSLFIVDTDVTGLLPNTYKF